MAEDKLRLGGFPYVIVGLSFIPFAGVLFGIIAIIWGLVTKKLGGKKLAVVGAIGIVCTIIIYTCLFYFVFMKQEPRPEYIKMAVDYIIIGLFNIPFIVVLVGIIAIIWGLVTKKLSGKKLAVIVIAGIAFTIVLYSGLSYFGFFRKQEPSPEYLKMAEFAGKMYTSAAKQADNNEPAGYLKLYEMATDDNDIYPTDWQEVAHEKVILLLYSNTELWVKTFSKVDSRKFKDRVKGIGVSQYPEGVSSDEQFMETIFHNLGKIRGNEKEMELVDYILGLYNRKRPSPTADIFSKKPN